MVYIVIISVLVVLLIGFLKIHTDQKNNQKRVCLINEFLEKLDQYIHNWNTDIEAYDWLTERVDTVQSYLGDVGIAAFYHPPYSSFYIKNLPIIVNILPELRFSLELRHRSAYENYKIIRDTCIRFRGISTTIKDSIDKKLSNPVMWFIEGIRATLTLPFIFLYWVGLIPTTAIYKIQSSFVHRLLTAIASLVSIFSSVVTLLDKWDVVVLFFNNLFP